MIFSSGISKRVVMRRPMVIEIDCVWISLRLWSKYIWEVPSGTIFSTYGDSVTSWDLLDSEWVEWGDSSFQWVCIKVLMYQNMQQILLVCSWCMGIMFYEFRWMDPLLQWSQLEIFYRLTSLSYYISDLFIYINNIINIILQFLHYQPSFMQI